MAPPGIHRTLVKVAPKQRSKAQEGLDFSIALQLTDIDRLAHALCGRSVSGLCSSSLPLPTSNTAPHESPNSPNMGKPKVIPCPDRIGHVKRGYRYVWSAAELQAKNEEWQLVCANVFGLQWSH